MYLFPMIKNIIQKAVNPIIPRINVIFSYFLKLVVDLDMMINRMFPPRIDITAPSVWYPEVMGFPP